MTTSNNLETVEFEKRGQSKRPYEDPAETGPRALYSFAGILFAGIGALVKQFAFSTKPPHTDVPPDMAADEGGDQLHAAPGEIGQSADERINDQGEAGDDAADGQARQPASKGTSIRKVSALPDLSGPSDPAEGFVRPSSSPPANDNTALRLPLQSSVSGADLVHHIPQSAPAGGADQTETEAPVASSPGNDPSNPNDPAAHVDPPKPGPTATDPEPSVKDRNRAPVVAAAVNLGDLTLNVAVIIGLSDLLAHASDPDGDSLSIANLVVNAGSIDENADGTWTFTPVRDDDGDVVFFYEITDGQVSVQQVAFANLVAAPVTWTFGDDEDEVMIGTIGNDYIAARGGSDIVYAKAGADVIDGGDGHDILSAGSGNDLVQGGNGNDVIDAGPGNDIVFAGAGDDFVDGGDGDDVIHGQGGNDTIIGGNGNDVADGGDGDDTFIASAPGSGTLQQAENGAEPQSPGAQTAIDPTDGDDIYDGGAGADTYDIAMTSADAVVDLTQGSAESADIGHDALRNIENVKAGSGNDIIIANAEQNVLAGGVGDDTFVFLNDDDTPPTPESWDRITDFEVGDRIDVSHIDADETSDGKQSFTFIGESDHFDRAGEVRYKHETREDGEHTMVLGNDDDDFDEDFVIDLDGWHDLAVDSFLGLS